MPLCFELVKDAPVFVTICLCTYRPKILVCGENFFMTNVWNMVGLVVALMTSWFLITLFATFMKEDSHSWDKGSILKWVVIALGSLKGSPTTGCRVVYLCNYFSPFSSSTKCGDLIPIGIGPATYAKEQFRYSLLFHMKKLFRIIYVHLFVCFDFLR